MDTGTGFVTGIKKGIAIHTRGTRIRVPGGYTVPVSITSLTSAPRVLRHRKKRPGVEFFFKASSAGLTNLRNQERF